MNTFLASVRAVYFLAAILLFGELAFRWWVERAVLRRLPEIPPNAQLALPPRFAILTTALAAAFLSNVLWFLAQTQAVSGMPLAALSRETLHSALFDTGFGQVSLVRFVLAVALAVALAILRKSKRTDAMTIVAGILALALLASIAWTGHANADQGQSRLVHLSADVMHLVAAGAWIGALPALAFILFHARRDASREALEFAALATRRFSILGLAAVSTLVITGVANSWYTLGSLPALFGTDYGRLLSFKVMLFIAMLALAAMNRFRYTPLLVKSADSAREPSRYGALARLRANAMGEFALGIAVVCIASALGATTPAAHGQTVWPFRYTFSLDAVREDSLSAAACVAAIAAAIILAVIVRRHRRLALAGAAGIALAALSVLLSLLAVPANPTTYFHSPVRYSAESIASGAKLYAAQCSICHGPQGHGDGPAAAALAERPTDLTEHVLHHAEGDVLWWIKHGIPDTPMPAFDGRMHESDIWNVINWLRAQAETEDAKDMGSAVHASAIEAPNFAFQIDHDHQESLADQRGDCSVLLVLFDPAESPARLRALAKSQRALEQAGLRVIAIPTHDHAASAGRLQDFEAPIVANYDPQISSAYAILAPANSVHADRSAPNHAEFLIDRQGYIRARWSPNEGGAWLQLPYLMRQLLAMNTEQPRPAITHGTEHVH